MIRIGRMTDYGILLLSAFARRTPESALTARSLSQEAQIPLPTVSKLLKLLCTAELLVSRRGVNGGYQLSRPAEDITIAEVIETLEGPIGITECSVTNDDPCSLQGICPLMGNWRKISETIRFSLASLTMADMVKPWPVTENAKFTTRVSR